MWKTKRVEYFKARSELENKKKMKTMKKTTTLYSLLFVDRLSEHTEVHFKTVRRRWIIKVWGIGIKKLYYTCNYKNGVPAYRRFDIDRFNSRLDSGVPSFGFSTHSVANRQRCDAIVPGRVHWHAIFLSRRARFENNTDTIKKLRKFKLRTRKVTSMCFEVYLFFFFIIHF